MVPVSVLGLVVAMASGCATTSVKLSRPGEAQEAKVERTQAQKLAVGPALVHAYPEASSGDLLLVKIQTGEASDCLQTNAVRSPLIAGKTAEVQVAADEMACVRSRRARPLKITWHLHPTAAPVPQMVAAVPAAQP